MKLSIGSDLGNATHHEDPDDDLVRQSLQSAVANVSIENSYFLILTDEESASKGHDFYMQALISEDVEFGILYILEYHEGAYSEHFQCLDLPEGTEGLEQLIQAFVSYLHKDMNWKTAFQWEHYSLP